MEGREQLLNEFERSGPSGIKFAALAGIKYPTFAAWLKRRRQQAPNSELPAKPADPTRWLETVVEQAHSSGTSSSTGTVLELPGGARMQIATVQQAVLAATLVRALEKPC